MYYGKMTEELNKLYSKYFNVWQCTPDFYENAEYDEDEYDEYVDDIKKALEMGVELPNIYPHDDEY